jgi:hypothetical protein
MTTDQQHREPPHGAQMESPLLNGIGMVDAGASAEAVVGGARELRTIGPRMANHGLAAAGQTGNIVRGALGNITGPISMMQGAVNLANGNTSQGVLDLGAGAAGTTSALLGLAGIACPPLAIGAGIASLAAFGNEEAQSNGWYGTNPDNTNASFFGSIGNEGGAAFDAGRRLYGNNLPERVIGNAVGGIAAAGAGAYRGGLNTVQAVRGGGVRALSMLESGAGAVGRGIRNVYGGAQPAAAEPGGDLMNYNYF